MNRSPFGILERTTIPRQRTRAYCFGLTAKLRTISPDCGFCTVMITNLIFLPIRLSMLSPKSLISIFKLVLLTAHAVLPWTGFLKPMIAGALNSSGAGRISAITIVMVVVPSGMSEPFSSAPVWPERRLSNNVFRFIFSTSLSGTTPGGCVEKYPTVYVRLLGRSNDSAQRHIASESSPRKTDVALRDLRTRSTARELFLISTSALRNSSVVCAWQA
jgi:hypothetical protein